MYIRGVVSLGEKSVCMIIQGDSFPKDPGVLRVHQALRLQMFWWLVRAAWLVSGINPIKFEGLGLRGFRVSGVHRLGFRFRVRLV